MQLDKQFNIVTNFLAYHNYDNSTHYDLILVLGNAIPSIALKAYELYLNKQATYFMIAGGIGHTTDLLVNHIPANIIEGSKKHNEAYLLKAYIESIYGKDDSILLEENSTNCGLNITYAFDELKKKDIKVQSVLLCHDPLLQRRIDLTTKKQQPMIDFTNYCAFIPSVQYTNNELVLENKCLDQWPLERYISLTLGEMERVINDENGYGPNGLNFIEAVEVPKEVMDSYQTIKDHYKDKIRKII